MKFEDVYRFFQEPQPVYVNGEAAASYVVLVLLQGDSYATEILQRLRHEHPNYQLSDTILYQVLQFLESEGWITTYWKKAGGRGRPRRMLQLSSDIREEAQKLAQLWQGYVVKAR